MNQINHKKNLYHKSHVMSGVSVPEIKEDGYMSQEEDPPEEIGKDIPYQEFQRFNTPDYQVSNFVKAVCRRVIPRYLWGSYHNQNNFFKRN